LAPDAPAGAGINKMEMYKKKFGEEKIRQIIPHMQDVGRQHNISFSYGGNVGNTFDSHRLISLAEKQGKQDALVEELFKNYFEREKCISDREMLLAAAREVGVSGAEDVLRGDAERSEVSEDLRRFADVARRGVPQFIINGRPLEPGALDSDAIRDAFERS